MALKLISKDSFPAYIALSTDISGSAVIEGASLIGKTIYTTDTPAWYIIIGASASAISVSEFNYPNMGV